MRRLPGCAAVLLLLATAALRAEGLSPTPQVEAPALLSPSAAVHVTSAFEAQVYAAFLDQSFSDRAPDAPLAVRSLLIENDSYDSWVPNERAWEQYLLLGTRGQGQASPEAQAAFLRRGQSILRFYTFPATRVPVELLRSDALADLLLNGGWPAFYGSHPKTQGVLAFTAIGFNAASTEAVFAVRLRCGKACGYRDLVLMRVVNGAWTLVEKQPVP